MKKRLVSILCVTMMAVSLVPGCGSDSGGEGGEDKITIGYAVHNFTNPYYTGIMDGGDVAAEELGCEVIWKSCESSIESEISIIENFIEQQVDVICMDPVDAEALVDVIQQATDAGIPVVTFNNIIENTDAYAFTPNSAMSATNLAEAMCAYLNYEGNVAILQEQPGNFSSDTHEQAYRDVMAKYPEIEIVGEQITDWDPDKALQITQTWLSTLDDLDAIITISGNSAASAAQAIEAAGMTDEIAVFSVDGMNNELVADGGQIADSASYTLVAGYWNIKMCYDISQDPESWPVVVQYTPDVTASEENFEIMNENGLQEQCPDIVEVSIDDAMAAVESGDPTTMEMNWDEGYGPVE